MSRYIPLGEKPPKTLWACRRFARQRWSTDIYNLRRRKRDVPCAVRKEKGLCRGCPGPVRFGREG